MAIVIILAAIFYESVDSWFPEQQHQESGVIIGKSFYPGYYTTIFVPSGKVTLPITQFIPDTWMVLVRSNSGKEASASVSQDFYSNIDTGKKVSITYHYGRISGEMHIDQLSSE